ncbi:MAG: tRNA threonylcarbamoyl adenosine modification protein, Sua5/YciO/YrdC/YwlC family [Parcubacteria bacterium C7867-006]|nr:MAG: tRNA threonylcarbamoyl adenosine modification protein, Sua5/YciO/YrdC/YwlC family [Parcubacteria bacterium C7867-006]
MNFTIDSAIEALNTGGVGVFPTDTLYGLVARALDIDAVNRVYKLKNRSDGKPFIILISSIDDLSILKISIDEKTKTFLSTVWPGLVSVILPCEDNGLSYLHSGMDLAIRLPNNEILINLIKETGPIVAPSANPEGLKPASNINEAKEYFGDNVEFYVDGGILDGEPSTLLSIKDGEIKVLRQGRFKI